MLLEILTDKSTNEYLSLYSFPFYHTYLVSLNIPLFLPPHKHPMPVIPVYWALGLPEEKSLWLVWKDRYFKWSVHTQPGHLAACLGHVDGTGKMEIGWGHRLKDTGMPHCAINKWLNERTAKTWLLSTLGTGLSAWSGASPSSGHFLPQSLGRDKLLTSSGRYIIITVAPWKKGA